MNTVQEEASTKRRRVSDAGLQEDPNSSAKKARVDESSASSSSNIDTSLEALLDLSNVENQDELQQRFDAVARALLCDYHLVVTRPGAQTKLEVMELEFYVQKEGFHEDPFTHGSEEQRIAGRWYFHRAPRRSEDSNRSLTSTTSWRSGSRKGLDLTIGRFPASTSSANPGPPTLLRGGILLRSIRVLGPKPKVVSGPSLLVDEVLSLSGAGTDDIGNLVNEKWEGNTSAFPSKDPGGPSLSYTLHVLPRETKVTNTVIYNSPRIGLDLSHPGTTGPTVRPFHSRIRFLPRMYRYFREPHLLTANGRCQTFVGVLHHCAKNLPKPKGQNSQGQATTQTAAEQLTSALKDLRLLGNICRTTGLREPTAKKYLDDFKNGRKGGADVLDQFVGAKGKGASSSPQKYLVMMGALSTLQLEDAS